jgi:hypothetical protein
VVLFVWGIGEDQTKCFYYCVYVLYCFVKGNSDTGITKDLSIYNILLFYVIILSINLLIYLVKC